MSWIRRTALLRDFLSPSAAPQSKRRAHALVAGVRLWQ
jgi:hypothetical protein